MYSVCLFCKLPILPSFTSHQTNYFILLFKLSTYIITGKPFTGTNSSILENSIQLVNILNHQDDDKPKFCAYKEFAASCIEEALGNSNPNKQDFFIVFRLFDQTYQNIHIQTAGHEDVDMFDEDQSSNNKNIDYAAVENENKRNRKRFGLDDEEDDNEDNINIRQTYNSVDLGHTYL